MIPFPDKKYGIIYADPPWDQAGDMYEGTNITDHYSTMSLDEICDLPVHEIASDNCLLFLWVTGLNLMDAKDVGEAWGFKYKTMGFVWYKHLPVVACYTMSDCEYCLIFKRGKIPQPRGKRNIRQFLSCKRGRHSDKPDEIRYRITEMFPTQSKIELFARVNGRLFPPMEGWDYWGNEA